MIKVNCFCDGIGFPYGEATNNRIIMVGKALISKGNSFKVFVNCKRSRNPLNIQVKGVYEELYFEHLNRSTKMGLPMWRNAINYFLVGFFHTFFTIRQLSKDKDNVIYLYSHGTFFNAYVSFFANLFKVPVVQEVNEWTEEVEEDFFTAFIYKSVMFRWAKGVIAISDNIIKQIEKHRHPARKIETIYLPVLADKNDWLEQGLEVNKTFVWCGLVDGYRKDVLFLIKALAVVNKRYPDYRLIICGKYKQQTEQKIKELISELNMNASNVVLTGYISDEQLIRQCQSATALLSPLWNDQRSIARFPTKIASFLFSARPVITCEIGEVGRFLTHMNDSLFFVPGNEHDLAEKMEYLIAQPEVANAIGKEGRKLAEDKFDFRAYGNNLNELFHAVLGKKVKKVKKETEHQVKAV